jgi:hypothetical protein
MNHVPQIFGPVENEKSPRGIQVAVSDSRGSRAVQMYRENTLVRGQNGKLGAAELMALLMSAITPIRWTYFCSLS